MLTIIAESADDALAKGLHYLKAGGGEVSPRGQRTIEYPTPVATRYLHPLRRVMFEPLRDANPFFHLMESLWILACREDVRFPTLFNSRLAIYSDDGQKFHGAYGFRIKDQIKKAVEKLTADPDTRQAVLQIWDHKLDLNIKSNDIPCNDMVFLKIRDGKLRITVANRSNDIIWGAYGANVVQFSMLQEYLAGMIGCGIGEYTQVSDSYHAYLDNPQWEKLKGLPFETRYNLYETGVVKPYPLVQNPTTFDKEVRAFCNGERYMFWDNSFFPEVAIPVFEAWFAHKDCNNGAPIIKEECKASDWRLACAHWLARRGDK